MRPGTLRYGLLTFRRSAVHLLVFALVLFLALAIVVGQGLAGNLAAGSVLQERLASVPYDFIANAPGGSPDTVTSELQSLPGVASVAAVLGVTQSGDVVVGSTKATQVTIVGVTPSFGDRIADVGWEGTFALSPNGTVLSQRVASLLNVSVLDTVQLGETLCNPTGGGCVFRSLSFVVTNILQEGTVTDTALRARFIAFIRFTDAQNLFAVIFGGNAPASYDAVVWIDRNALLSPLDPEGSMSRVARIQRSLELVLGTTVSSPLLLSLQGFANQLAPLQALFLALAVPAMAVAFSLGLASLNTAARLPLEHLRLMRTRGLRNEDALLILLSPILLVAIAVVAVGFVTLPATVAVLPVGFAATGPAAAYPSWGLLGLSGLTILTGAGYVAILLSAYGRTAAARLSAPYSKWHLHPTGFASLENFELDYLLLIFGILLWFYLAFLNDLRAIFPGLTTLLGDLINMVAPLGGILVVAGAVRPILAHPSARRTVGRPFTRASGPIGRRFLPGRVARATPRAGVPLVVALAVALVLMGFITLDSEAMYNEKVAEGLLGADLNVEAMTSRDLLPRLTALPGIVAGTAAETVPPFSATPGSILLFNATTYQAVVGSDPYFFSDVGGSVGPLVAGQYAVIVNTLAARAGNLKVGERMLVTYSSGTIRKAITVNVTGIVKALPGLRRSGIENLNDPLIYGDRDTFYHLLFPGAQPPNPAPFRFLMRAAPDAFLSALRGLILQRFPVEVDAIQVRGALPQEGGLNIVDLSASFLRVQAYTTYALVLLAVALMTLTLFREERLEIATIRARGANRRGVMALLWADASASATVGILIGLAGGLLGSLFLVSALSKTIDPSALDRSWLFGLDTAAVTVGFVLLLFGVLAAIAWSVAQPRISEVLKEGIA